MPRYPLLPNCIFRETFESQQRVAQNGGVVTGTPVINNGVTLDGSAQYITYTKNLYGIKAVSVRMNVTSTTARLFDLDGGTHYLWINAGTVTAQGFSSPTIYIDGVATSTITTGLHTITVTTATAFNGVNVVVGKVGVNYGAGTFYDTSIFTQSFTADEALDLYQQDTISELDASKALVYLPLKSWHYKENGTQILNDGDMEAAGVAAWSVDHSATLTKETSSPQSGTQWLKIAYNGVINPGAYQLVVTSGKRYKLSGYIKGDGTQVPQINSGATVVWMGTSSTSWQAIGGTTGYIEFIAGGSYVELLFVASDGYVGADNLRVELMEARTDNIGSLGGHALLGDGSTTTTFPTQLNPHGMSFDGGDYLKVDAGIGPLLTLSMPFTFSVLMYDDKGLSDTTGYSIGGTWDTAQSKGILFYKYPSASYGPGVLIGSSSGNFIEARGNEAPRGIHLYTFTYDGSGTFAGLRIYIDGKLSSWINGSTGTLGTDIVSGRGVILGARWNGAASPHQFLTSGKRILDFSIYPFVLTPAQVKMLSDNINKTKNV